MSFVTFADLIYAQTDTLHIKGNGKCRKSSCDHFNTLQCTSYILYGAFVVYFLVSSQYGKVYCKHSTHLNLCLQDTISTIRYIKG